MDTQNISHQSNSPQALSPVRHARMQMVQGCLQCACEDVCLYCCDWRYLNVVGTFGRYRKFLGLTQRQVERAVDDLCRAQLAEVEPWSLMVTLTEKGKM